MRIPAVFILVGMVSVFAAGPAQAEPVFNSSITYIGAANDPNYHNWRLEVTNDSLEDIPPNHGKVVNAYAENTSDVNFPVPPMDANMAAYWNVNYNDANMFSVGAFSSAGSLTPSNALYVDFISDSNMLIDSEIEIAAGDGYNTPQKLGA